MSGQLTASAAQAFADALKAEARSQPETGQVYELSRDLKLRVTYRPPRRKGRIDLRDVTQPNLLYTWQVWARKWYEAAMPYVEEDAKGWKLIDEPKALAFLEGGTLAEYEAREAEAAADVFARIARGT